ncbi:Zinc protease [Labilithrix luteola]|uniref:Zinc protease n=1 Tax=Labilithrix luteola TaxID=1391654 RepID=A0A0K1PLB8_9BACT|nr:pitrilysin family protein [Labilithrix luteola]AKU94315.1 Zinc protease [Labilithrix luteola]
MRLSKLRASLAFAIVSLAGCAGPRHPNEVTLKVALPATHFRLENGLEVLLHEDHSTSDVVVNLRYHVGSKDDPEGRSGFAHLYEHMMFLGTKHVGDDGFAAALEKIGVREFNATTNEDRTEYYDIVPARQLPAALWLEATRMAYPLDAVEQQNFDREREVVKNEWRERYDNVPLGHLHNLVREAVFPAGHPYHHPTIGRPTDLDRATLEEARAFGATYYTPVNATLVIAGDFDKNQAHELVARYFGNIPSGKPNAPKSLRFQKIIGKKRIVVEADVETPRVVLAWPIPPPHTRGYDELMIAAGYATGWANYELVATSKMARLAWTDVDTGRLGSILSITVDLEPNGNPEKAIDAIDDEIRRIPDHRDWPDFSDRRTARMTSAVLGLQSIDNRAAWMQESLSLFGTHDVSQSELQRIQDIHAPNMVAATTEYLRDTGRIEVVVRPKRGAPRAGRVVQ